MQIRMCIRFNFDILHKVGSLRTTFFHNRGVVAHLVEHLVRNQKVVGSSPIYSTCRGIRCCIPFFVITGQ